MGRDAASATGRRARLGLAVLALPTVVIGLDMTVLHLATPSIAADLRPSPEAQLWIVDVYGFAVAGLLLTMGNVGDRVGRRRLLLAGAAGFAVASTIAAFAPSPGLLITARALLGVAGATLMPSTLSLIRNLFPDDRRRTVAISVWMASLLTGSAIGPLVGGIVLELSWWGAAFLLGVPIMVALLVVGPFVLPAGRSSGGGPLDLASVGLSLLAVLPVVYAVKAASSHGLDVGLLGLVAVGAVAGVLFVRRQRRLARPLLDVGLFTDARFSTATVTHLVSLLVQGGTQYLFALYLQLAVGLDPLAAGLWMLPAAGLGLLGAVVAPVLAGRLGSARVLSGGLALSVVGAGVTALTSVDGLTAAVTGFALISFAVGLVTTLTTDHIIAAAPAERAGMASGITETSAELGIALGVALLGSVATAVQVRATAEPLVRGAGFPVRDAFTDGVRLSAAVGAVALVVLTGLAVRYLREPATVAPTER